MSRSLAIVITASIFLSSVIHVFADYRIRQQITIGNERDVTMDRSIWIKGARERSITKFVSEGMDMSAMMPTITEIMQCDLRQTIKINEASKRYFIEPFYESDNKPLPPAEPSTRTTVRKGGKVTWTFMITDTGQRQQMFGFAARKLIVKQLVESSKDSCGGETKLEMIEEGWYAHIIPESARCETPLPKGEGSDQTECRDDVTRKGAFQYPGLLLDGTMTMNDMLRREVAKQTIKTLDVSKETLAMGLFEAPAGFTEVNSMQSLMSRGVVDNVAKMTSDVASGKTAIGTKPIGVDFFAGNVSKINQEEMRRYIAGKFSAKGQNATLVVSQNDVTSGAYIAIIGVQIKNIKESGAAKIGGLFGRVTGADDAAKIGESEAEIVMTAYAADGKTVLATATSKKKVSGKADDAMKAAIDEAFSQVAGKVK